MMNEPLPQHLQAIVEKLCNEGCKSVNSTIEDLDNNAYVAETAELDDKERNQVLTELKHIMSVYDQ